MNTGLSFRGLICAAATLVLVASVAIAYPRERTPAPRDRTPPTTPANLRVTGASDYSVSLAWNASSDNSGFWYYRLVSSAGVTVDLDRTQTSYSFTTGHTAGSTYTFYVYAVDGSRNRSANSNTVSATLAAAGTVPSAPVVTVTDVGPTHITVGWAAPFNAGPPVRYWVYVDGQTVEVWYQTTAFTLYYVEPGSTHTFSVQARDGRGRFSAPSGALTVTAPASDPNDTAAPTTPANLWAGGFGDGSTELEVNWAPSSDNVTAQAYIRYDVYLNGEWLDATVGRTRVTEYGVFGENRIEVVAVDEAGNEAGAAVFVTNIP